MQALVETSPNNPEKVLTLHRAAQTVDAVRKAFEIELGGHAFYERASRDARDPVLGELFGRDDADFADG